MEHMKIGQHGQHVALQLEIIQDHRIGLELVTNILVRECLVKICMGLLLRREIVSAQGPILGLSVLGNIAAMCSTKTMIPTNCFSQVTV